eukprot:maker-scaffold288_size220435-snap-gene-1.21 protein:Tk01469 transcript:maker-scaffold288_size220435-snap-gene-1.21-mRNA-1 annotation:"hypothetical protein Y032_0322g2447"
MDNKAKRSLVIDLLKKKTSYNIIKKVTGAIQKYIWRCKKRIESKEGAARRPGSGKTRSVRSKHLIKVVANKVMRNPTRSMNKMAKEHNLSRKTLQRIVKENLGLDPFKIQRRQLLSKAPKEKRLSRSKLLKSWIAQNPAVVIIYSDEKLFDVSRKFNKQNTRVLGKELSEVDPSHRFALRTQKPDSINQEVYLQFLEEKVKPWIDGEFPDVETCFTQDSAPAHGANRVARRGMVEAEASGVPRRSKEHLMRTIELAWDKIDEDTVRFSSASVKSRLTKVILARDNVTLIRLATFITDVVGTRKIPAATSLKDTLPSVVMKVDIEGSEVEIFPDLTMMGALSFIDFIMIEWHDNLAKDERITQTQMARKILENLAPLSDQLKMSHKLNVVEQDDETYFGSNEPFPEC